MAWSKESRQVRGYGADWDRLRKQIMERDGGLCQPCRKAGVLGVIAHAVDHIISKAKAKKLGWTKAKTDHPSNLQAICEPCHKQKTAEEEGKTFRPKQRIGEDGFPVDQ